MKVYAWSSPYEMHEGVFKNTYLVVQLESWNMEHKEQTTVSGTAKLENIDKMLSCWKRLKAKFPKLSRFRLILETNLRKISLQNC